MFLRSIWAQKSLGYSSLLRVSLQSAVQSAVPRAERTERRCFKTHPRDTLGSGLSFVLQSLSSLIYWVKLYERVRADMLAVS